MRDKERAQRRRGSVGKQARRTNPIAAGWQAGAIGERAGCTSRPLCLSVEQEEQGEGERTMAYNYVATCQKSTGVTHAFTAAFTEPEDLNLVVVTSSRLEVHALGPEGLLPVRGMCVFMVVWG